MQHVQYAIIVFGNSQVCAFLFAADFYWILFLEERMFARFSRLVAPLAAATTMMPMAATTTLTVASALSGGGAVAVVLRRFLSLPAMRNTLAVAPWKPTLASQVSQISVRTIKVRTAVKKRCEECYFGECRSIL